MCWKPVLLSIAQGSTEPLGLSDQHLHWSHIQPSVGFVSFAPQMEQIYNLSFLVQLLGEVGEGFSSVREPIPFHACGISKRWAHTPDVSCGIFKQSVRPLHVLLRFADFRFEIWQCFYMQSKLLTCHLFKANCLRQDSLAKQDIMLSVCERMSEVPRLCRIQGPLPSRQNVLFTEERKRVCHGES